MTKEVSERVRWMRTLQIRGPKIKEAMAWINELGGYMKQNHGKYPVQVFVDSSGEPETVRWIIDYERGGNHDHFQYEAG
jgi:hypothetical protein